MRTSNSHRPVHMKYYRPVPVKVEQSFPPTGVVVLIVSFVVFVLIPSFLVYSPFLDPLGPLQVSVESITVSRLSATGSECSAEWELKLVVTNPNGKYGYDLYFEDRLQATLFVYDRWFDGSFMLATKSLSPPLPLTNETSQTATLNFKMQTDSAYLGEVLSEEISRGIVEVHLIVTARYMILPTTGEIDDRETDGLSVLRLFCPNSMGLCEDKTMVWGAGKVIPGKVNQIRDKFEYDRERRMRKKRRGDLIFAMPKVILKCPLLAILRKILVRTNLHLQGSNI